MKLRTAERKQARIRLALQGPSGSGKTMSALLVAYGITNSWNTITVIDSENGSADLYAHMGPYKVLTLGSPFPPEKYIEAIHLCESIGTQVIILDSISHEWDGLGGILSIHGNMQGNSFTNWNKVTPRHNAFVQSILQSPAHVIATIRSKQDYVLSEKNGKYVPEKVGLKGITRDGMDYEFTLAFDLNLSHHAHTSKDRTGLFMDKPDFKITTQTGTQLRDWCNSGTTLEELEKRIGECSTVEELKDLYDNNLELQLLSNGAFHERKMELLEQTETVKDGTI